MILAQIDPNHSEELTFNININGTNENPSDIRFIIEGIKFGDEGVRDVFAIICKVVRSDDVLKVKIPRLLKLVRSGTYNARLEVVLEDRIFTPLSEQIEIVEPIGVTVKECKEEKIVKQSYDPEISINVKPSEDTIQKVMEQIKIIEDTPVPIKKFNPEKIHNEDDSNWKNTGFSNIKNPFK